MLCGIGQIIVGGGIMGRAYLGWFLLVVEQGTTVSGYSWCHIFTDPTKNEHIMYLCPVLCYFIKWFWEGSVGIWNLCLCFFSLVPPVNHCPKCGIVIGTLVWEENEVISWSLTSFIHQPQLFIESDDILILSKL